MSSGTGLRHSPERRSDGLQKNGERGRKREHRPYPGYPDRRALRRLSGYSEYQKMQRLRAAAMVQGLPGRRLQRNGRSSGRRSLLLEE